MIAKNAGKLQETNERQEPFNFDRLARLCKISTPKKNESDILGAQYRAHSEIKTLAEYAKLVDGIEIGDGN